MTKIESTYPLEEFESCFQNYHIYRIWIFFKKKIVEILDPLTFFMHEFNASYVGRLLVA